MRVWSFSSAALSLISANQNPLIGLILRRGRRGHEKKLTGTDPPVSQFHSPAKQTKKSSNLSWFFPTSNPLHERELHELWYRKFYEYFVSEINPLVLPSMIDFSICLFQLRTCESLSFETQPTIIFIAVASDWNWNRDISRFPGFMNKRGTFKSFLMRSGI